MTRAARLLVLLAPLLVVAALPARAGSAVLLRDIDSVSPPDPLSSRDSDPEQLTSFQGGVAFVALGEVWATDGTGAGTRMLVDLCPGDCSSNPRILGTVNNRLLWLASPNASLPARLWSSDGTPVRTLPLTESSLNIQATAFTGRALYFGACGFDRGCDLWKSDGTEAGTRAVKTLTTDFSSSILGMAAVGDRLFLSLYSSTSSWWTSDGTAAGTVRLLEVDRISNFGFVGPPIAAAGRVYSFANNGTDGPELWVSDGTVQGTRALTAFPNHNPFEPTGPVTISGSRIYFVANDVVHGHEIWVSDGTPQGTRRMTDFGFYTPFETSFQEGRKLHLGETGGKLIFPATDGLSPKKLWITDGRPESTAPLDSLCPGGCSFSFNPYTFRELVQAGGRVLFVTDDGGHGNELWSTDGTAAGTRLVRELCAGCNPDVRLLGALDGKALFFATSRTGGTELWLSDGTAAGTRPLTNMPTGQPVSGAVAAGGQHFFAGEDEYGVELRVTSPQGGTRLVADLGTAAPSSNPGELTPVGDRLFFSASDGRNRGLWHSSGTPESTVLVPDPPTGPYGDSSTGFAAVGDRFVFQQSDAESIIQLWSTDGTDRVQLTHFDEHPYIQQGAQLQGRLFFPVQHAGGEPALWSTDGTPQGTAKAFALPELFGTSGLTALGDAIYFLKWGQNGPRPWRTDGTAAGTWQLADIPTLEPFVRAGSLVYFMGAEPDGFDGALWRTDGTPAGTSRLKVLGGLSGAAELQGLLYFIASSPGNGPALWRSDGTEAGTYAVLTLAPYTGRVEPPLFDLRAFAGRLWFAGVDAEHGVELWTSDGTAEGTRLWKDLVPGPFSSNPRELTVAGGRLFFSALDSRHGIELWSTDGTEAGTRLEHDLAPQAASSSPHQLTATGSHLYFIADDGLSGDEVWALPLSGGGCQPAATRLCLNGGRYQVEAAWRDFQGNRGAGQATALTADTGHFWFFSPSNVEVVLKVLDGRGTNDHIWVFYGALSSIEYTLTVTDTESGLTRRYFNPSGQLASVGDTTGFGPLGATSTAPGDVTVASPSPLPLISGRTDKAAATGSCQAAATRLCLQGGRFAVEATWKDFQSRTGAGQAVPLTADTGYFWFFGPENLEVMIKALDGTALNGKHWVFYGALSNVEYRLTVTDTQTGQVRVYQNPSGRFASVADTEAF